MTFISALLVLVAALLGVTLALADTDSLAQLVKAALSQGQEQLYNTKCPTGWQQKQFGPCNQGVCQTYCAIQCGTVYTETGEDSVANSAGTCAGLYCNCAASTDTTQTQGEPAPAPHKPNHKAHKQD